MEQTKINLASSLTLGWTMPVSKKVDGKYVAVGSVQVPFPSLEDLGFQVAYTKLDEEGLPVYEDAKDQYTFDAIMAAVKANARNKLVTGTSELKDGNKIATTLAELFASGERSGQALELLRAFVADFKSWVVVLGKTAAINDALTSLIQNKKSLASASDDIKGKINGFLGQFMTALSDEKVEAYAKIFESLDEVCSTASLLDDL